jgi:hypothetical protein
MPLKKLTHQTLQQLCIGSGLAATIRRAGGTDLMLDDQGQPLASGCYRNATLDAKINTGRATLIAFLDAEAR